MMTHPTGVRTLLVCKSASHGNTMKVARAMAEVLGATVVEPEDVEPSALGEFDLVGFGSGIYFMRFHDQLYELIDQLPTRTGQRAFLFATSGSRELPFLSYTRPMMARLSRKGFSVCDTFSCRGWDTVGPLGLIGGINRGHPTELDLQRARSFAARIAREPAPSR